MSELTQVISFFCEGPHDVAFIYKLLKTINYQSYDKCKIGDLPVPFDQLILKEVEKSDVNNLNIVEVRRGFLPSRILHNNEKCVFLYSLGGESKQNVRQSMLSDLNSFIAEEGEISRLPEEISLSVIYLFDADNKGINLRLNYINNEINQVLAANGNIEFTNNGEFQTVRQIKYGAFIFTGEDNNTGTLESILVPLMRKENEEIFSDALTFIKSHHDDNRLFPLKISQSEGMIEEKRSARNKDKYKFYHAKSLIGTVGQLQCSGKSNVVCISDSDYLTLVKINGDQKCTEVLNFLNKI